VSEQLPTDRTELSTLRTFANTFCAFTPSPGEISPAVLVATS